MKLSEINEMLGKTSTIENNYMDELTRDGFGDIGHHIGVLFKHAYKLEQAIQSLTTELDGANNLLREIAMRNQLSFPSDEQDLDWFDNGMNANVGVKLVEYLDKLSPTPND